MFLCGPARLRRTVTRVAIYPSVAALAAHEDYRRVMPWLASAAEMAAVYESFPGYPGRIARHGLVAMELAPPEAGRSRRFATPAPPMDLLEIPPWA